MTRPAWTIRPKGERDVPAVLRLLAAVSREGGFIATEWPFDVDERARAMRDALLERRALGWIALDGRTVIGDLTVFDLQLIEPELGMVVDAAYRGRGIGRALIDAAVAWARANERPALRLRVFPDNEPALALYRASGFVQIELQRAAIVQRNGTARDAIVMRLDTA
ncbi:MAG TPA: GNAT family N-acetyltransferase [Candidatus Elarobacter sp.]|jgi:RimJ/RimL family protein N-acetyltransferase